VFPEIAKSPWFGGVPQFSIKTASRMKEPSARHVRDLIPSAGAAGI
jgi:hypothetical protein